MADTGVYYQSGPLVRGKEREGECAFLWLFVNSVDKIGKIFPRGEKKVSLQKNPSRSLVRKVKGFPAFFKKASRGCRLGALVCAVNVRGDLIGNLQSKITVVAEETLKEKLFGSGRREGKGKGKGPPRLLLFPCL